MKESPFHRLGKFVSILLVTWSLAACAPVPAASTPTPLPMDLKVGMIAGTAGAPIIVPAEEGLFAAHGLNVSLEQVNDTAQAMISVAAGHFDLAIVTMGPAALNVFDRGADLKIIAAGAAQPLGHGDNLPLVVRTQLVDSGDVKTAADLKGRKVALNTRGAGGDYKLAKALATGNLRLGDVEIVTMPFPDMIAAFTTGAIDAGLILQPTAAQAVAKGVGKIVLDNYDQNGQGGLLVANSRLVEQHRDAVTRFLEVYVQAIRRFSDGKIKADDQALAALQNYTSIAPEVTRLGPDPYWPKDGHVLVDSLRDQQGFFIGIGSTDYTQPLDIEKLIDYGPLDAALKDIGA